MSERPNRTSRKLSPALGPTPKLTAEERAVKLCSDAHANVCLPDDIAREIRAATRQAFEKAAKDLVKAINTERPIMEMERLIAKYRALAKEQADGNANDVPVV